MTSVNDRPDILSERAPHINNTTAIMSNVNLVLDHRWGLTPRLTISCNVILIESESVVKVSNYIIKCHYQAMTNEDVEVVVICRVCRLVKVL
jgi:hypothetical protein